MITPGRSCRAKSAAAVEVTAMGARACLFCKPRFASPRQVDSRNADNSREKRGNLKSTLSNKFWVSKYA